MEFPLFKNFIIADLLQAISSAFAALTLFIIIYAKFVSKVTVFKGHKVETTLKTQVVLSLELELELLAGWLWNIFSIKNHKMELRRENLKIFRTNRLTDSLFRPNEDAKPRYLCLTP